jgi:hypothetical protein
MAMRRDLESILRRGRRKLPKVCRSAEDNNPVALLRPILATTESPRRANRIVTADSVRAPVEETAPTKAAGSRNSGFNEAVRGTTPVSVRRSPVTSRHDAASLLRSKQKPLPAGPAGRTTETAADIVVTTANGGPVASYALASSALPSGSALPHLDEENRDHINKMHRGKDKSIPPKRVNGTPPAKPKPKLNLAPVTPDNAAARRYANAQVKTKLDGSHPVVLRPITEESDRINTNRVDPRGPRSGSNLALKRREMSAPDSPSPPSRIILPRGYSNPRISATAVDTNKELSSTSKRHHGGSRRAIRPPVKDTHMGETFRHPVVEVAAPPQDLKRADEPLLTPRKDRAVATGAVAIPTPDPTPERQANRANRTGASTHARIAPIAKRPSIHVKGPDSYATHVEYPLSGAADAGSSPDLTKGGDSLYHSALSGVDSKGVAPSNTALKPGPSGVVDAGVKGDSPHPSPSREAIDSGSTAPKPGMRCPSGAMDTGSSSDSSGGGDSLYPSPPGLEGVDSESVASHSAAVPPGMRRPPSEGVDSKVVGGGTTGVVYRIPSKIPGRFRAVKVIYLRQWGYEHVKGYACEVAILQKLQKENAARRALGENVDPGIERVFGRPDDYMELRKDGCLRIETVSLVFFFWRVSLIFEAGILPDGPRLV